MSSLTFPEPVLTPSIGYAARLAYLRWMRAAGRLKPETDRELAQAWGVGEKWFAKWKASDDAPDGRTEHKAIEQALGPAIARWLYDDEGEAPEPALWTVWFRAYRTQPKPVTGPLKQITRAGVQAAKKTPGRRHA